MIRNSQRVAVAIMATAMTLTACSSQTGSVMNAASTTFQMSSLNSSTSQASSMSRYTKMNAKTPLTVKASTTRATASVTRSNTPQWAKEAIFYQIFPERFNNGDKSNDPAGIKPWGTKPGNFDQFGGDLNGVIQKMSYIKDLGVNALYFNPVFEAPSNHKYDTADYTKIDDNFGGNQTFQTLLSNTRSAGMKVILDGVFNHTGDKHVAFLDAIANGPSSKYWSWYTVRGDKIVQNPPNYNCWWGFGSLPQLNTGMNDIIDNHLLNEVTAYWLKQGIDGWRLDVPNEVRNWDFWKKFRNTVKSTKPDAYTVGEIWEDASSWVQGDKFDSVMNYVWRKNMVAFFAEGGMSVDTFDQNLTNLRLAYPKDATEVMFNILSSHDTPRFLSLAGENKWKLKAASFFQMTYVGTPVIWYGDEIGMTGGMDPDCRRTMDWNNIDQDMLNHYKKLIKIRKAHPALSYGYYQGIMKHNDKKLYAYARHEGTDKLICALNNGDSTQDVTVQVNGLKLGSGAFDLTTGTSVTDLMTGKSYPVTNGTVTLKLDGHVGAILQAASKK